MSNDLISRQAAIDAFTGVVILEPAQSAKKYIDGVIERIQNLPSAQPEIVQCKDCKYGAPNGKYGCRVYHYKRYETHDMKPDDFCSRAERRTE